MSVNTKKQHLYIIKKDSEEIKTFWGKIGNVSDELVKYEPKLRVTEWLLYVKDKRWRKTSLRALTEALLYAKSPYSVELVKFNSPRAKSEKEKMKG